MSNSVEITFFKPDDVTKYLSRIERTDNNGDFCDVIADNGDEIFEIRLGGEVVGLAYIEDDEKEAFIYVHVFPEFRLKGYGRRAAVAAERELKKSPEKIMTGFGAGEEPAKKLAGELGYKKKFASAKMKYRGGSFGDGCPAVRKYRDADFDAAFSLTAEAFHVMRLGTGCFPESVLAEPREDSRENWAKEADNEYVLELGGEIVGFAQAEDDMLDCVAIRTDRQGEGLGRSFVKYMVDRIIESGHPEPVLWCVVGNDKARRLYESLGFEEIARAEYSVKKPGLPRRYRQKEQEDMIYEITDVSKIKALFGDWRLPLFLNYAKDPGLKYYADDPDAPRSAMLLFDDFACFAGEPDRELVINKPKGFVAMEGQTEGWEKLILECYPEAEIRTRYAIKKETHFDREKLRAIIDALPEGYELRPLDSETYDMCVASTDPDVKDVAEEFEGTKEEFFENGRGFVVIKDGKVVSGASSCEFYRDGIEIEIDTAKNERRKGLASAAGAALILSCLDDGLVPRWDAANMISVRLSEKLGYEFSHEYRYYRVSGVYDVPPYDEPDKSKWASFCGKYETLCGDFLLSEVFMKDGELYGIQTGREDGDYTFRLFPLAENKFGRAGGTVQVTFGDGCLTIDGVTCKKL